MISRLIKRARSFLEHAIKQSLEVLLVFVWIVLEGNQVIASQRICTCREDEKREDIRCVLYGRWAFCMV